MATPKHRAATIPAMRRLHSDEECELVLDTMDAVAWNLTQAAARLDVTASSLQAILRRHDIYDLYTEHARGPGRPASRSGKK